MATKMKMVMKGGKMVPAFAADGKGKMQMGGVKKLQKGGPVDGPMEARRKIMGEKKPSLKKTLRYVRKNGSGYIPSSTTKKMQYGGDNMSLGPVSNFKLKPPTSSTSTPTPAPTPAPTSVKEAREQARIAKINAKTAAYNSGVKVPGATANKILDAGVEGARIFNNVMQARQGNNNGGMKKGGSTKKYQNGGSTGAQLKAKGQAMKAKGAAMKEKGELMKSRGQNYRIYQVNKALDSFFMGDAVRAKSAQINKSIDPTRNKINAKVGKVNNKLTPYVNATNRAIHGPAKIAKNQKGGPVMGSGRSSNTNTTLGPRLKMQKGVLSSKQYASILKNGKSIPATKRKKI